MCIRDRPCTTRRRTICNRLPPRSGSSVTASASRHCREATKTQTVTVELRPTTDDQPADQSIYVASCRWRRNRSRRTLMLQRLVLRTPQWVTTVDFRMNSSIRTSRRRRSSLSISLSESTMDDVRHVEFNQLLLFIAQCRYSEIAQRIFKHSNIQYTSLTLDKKLNSLMYRTLFYVNTYWTYKLPKNSPFLAHPVAGA